ncbi:MAG: integrase catalytic domain-containing protein [Mariniphaga sp.]|nr:integrase catalytic domain-containing protein [Mariniphaga sp.]
MVNLTYYIDKSNADKNGYSPIKANVTIDYKNITKTIEKVKARYWNKNQQRVSPPKPHEPDNSYEAINETLDNFQDEFKAYFKECSRKNIPITQELVKDYFKGIKLNLGTVDFWKAYDHYLQTGKLDKSYNTNCNRLTIYNKLKDFETDTGYKLTFDSVNLVFWDKLKEYMLETKEHGYNYLSAVSDKFRAFMNWCQERNYHTNQFYKKFSAPEKEISIVALTFDELQHLIDFEFESKKLQKARDFFCFGCLTGLRYVDLVQLTKDNISNGMLKITTQKTNKEVVLPIFPGVQTIIDRYPDQYKLLPKFSNQKLNDYIKDCCEEAEINTPTEYKTHLKNETIKEFKPKHELIGTHAARKTFICLAYERGLDIEMIKSCTGITQEKTLKRYLQISTETKKEKLSKAFGSL